MPIRGIRRRALVTVDVDSTRDALKKVPDRDSVSLMSHTATLTALADWGLPVEPHWALCTGIDEVAAFCEQWEQKSFPNYQ